MKYIRTKDGIYEINRYYEPRDYYWVKQDCEQPISSDEIIKQADTIEELCDEAVFFDKDNKPHYKSQEGNLWYLGAGLFIETLRFCIFTDKGLIYVAKMNEKGDLELL